MKWRMTKCHCFEDGGGDDNFFNKRILSNVVIHQETKFDQILTFITDFLAFNIDFIQF
jgi:hypothetical protein